MHVTSCTFFIPVYACSDLHQDERPEVYYQGACVGDGGFFKGRPVFAVAEKSQWVLFIQAVLWVHLTTEGGCELSTMPSAAKTLLLCCPVDVCGYIDAVDAKVTTAGTLSCVIRVSNSPYCIKHASDKSQGSLIAKAAFSGTNLTATIFVIF